MHNHQHGEISVKNLWITMVLNFLITVVEVVGGLLSGSLSLLSDALHNLSDGVSVIISIIALKMGKMHSTLQKTFGYKRAEILAAVINSSVLIVISFYLFKEAYHRLLEPVAIKGGLMVVVATIGLAANTLAVFLLKRDASKSINIKSSYLHLLSDALSSAAVIVGGLFIIFFDLYWIDPVLTILIGLFVLKESYLIMKEATNILMQGTPEHIDILKIKTRIEEMPEVGNLHHVHVWQISDHEIHFEGHIEVDKDYTVNQCNQILTQVEKMLEKEFDIRHVTLQFEYNQCPDPQTLHP